MKKHFKNVLYGFLSWLIPFISAFFFYTRKGELTIDKFLFKSIMIIVGTITAAFLLVSYFKKIAANYLKEGITIGLTWLSIGVLLDLLVLIPMSGIMQIGLRYLVIPVTSITVGMVLENKKQGLSGDYPNQT